MKTLLLIFLSLAGIVLAAAETVPVLCLAGSDTAAQGLDGLDPKTVEVFREAGYELHFDYYQRIDKDHFEDYAVIVAMIPQLHAGSLAFDPEMTAALDAYLRRGGAVLVMTEPSYYGVDVFPDLVNPFLERYDAAISGEIPYAPEYEFTDNRVLPYRFFTTANLDRNHPVTAGIDRLIFPLDFNYHYVQTYTMSVGDEWEILARAEASAFTSARTALLEGRPEPGLWDSAPPLLALRRVGDGFLAILASSSRYFLYDAYHWAVSEGLVLEEGNGLRLLSGLFAHMTANHIPIPDPPVRAAGAPQSRTGGNLPVVQEKTDWYGMVLDQIENDGCGLAWRVDCGAVSDLPYSPERGYGYCDRESWLIRWTWAEIFHPTAANVRAADRKPILYRFDRLDPAASHRIGLLLWTWQEDGARDLEVSAGGRLLGSYALPRYDLGEGPRLEWLEVPQEALRNGSLELEFAAGPGGAGSFTGVGEIWLAAENRPLPTPQEVAARFDSPSEGGAEMFRQWQPCYGLIGVRSGVTPVAEMARAAREAGLDFIVYTDPLAELDQRRWDTLREECRAASDETLLVLPGLELTAAYRDRERRPDDPQSEGGIGSYFFGGIRQLPDQEMLGNPYELFWKFFGGALAGGHATPGNLVTPGTNAIPPFFQRFWRGFDLLTFDESGQIRDDSRPLFLDLLTSGYGPRPRVSGVYRTPGELIRAARGWRTVVWTPEHSALADMFYSSGVTSGPRLNQAAFSSDWTRSGEIGNDVSIRQAGWFYARLDAEYEHPISEVVLLVNGRAARRFRPDSTRVLLTEALRLDGQSQLSWYVRASDGTEAWTGSFQVLDERFRNAMCADNQNSICSVTRPPTRFLREERELYLQHSYWHTGEAAGQLGVMRDARELVPRIIETGIIQLCKYFHPEVTLFTAGGRESHHQSEMRIRSASQNHYRITYDFDRPDARLSSHLELTAFRPDADRGATAVLVENTVTAREALPASEWEGLQVLGAALMPNFPPEWQYTLASPGGLVSGSYAELGSGEVRRQRLAGDGGAMIWPNELASLAVLPLDGREYTAGVSRMEKAWNGRELLTLGLPPRDLAGQESFTVRYLVMLTQSAVSSENDLLRLREEYTGRGRLVEEVTQGELERADYVLDFAARDGAAAWKLAPCRGVDPIPFRVSGLNPNWSGLVARDGELAPAHIDSGTLYGLAGSPEPETVAAGHPLTAGDPELIMEWDCRLGNQVRLRVHNPTGRFLRTEIRSNPAFALLPAIASPIELAPGESRFLIIDGR